MMSGVVLVLVLVLVLLLVVVVVGGGGGGGGAPFGAGSLKAFSLNSTCHVTNGKKKSVSFCWQAFEISSFMLSPTCIISSCEI